MNLLRSSKGQAMLSAVASIFLASTSAAVPSEVPYIGLLSHGTGATYNGLVNVTTALYETADAEEPVWGPQLHPNLMVTNGLVSLVLGGAGMPLEGAWAGQSELWLGIRVGAVELLPRQRVLSVPFAILAGEAETLGGLGPQDVVPRGEAGSISSEMIAPGAVGLGQLATGAVQALRQWGDLIGIPAGFADGIDDVLSPAEVRAIVEAQPLDLAAGTTVGGQPIGSGNGSAHFATGQATLAPGDSLDVPHSGGPFVATTVWAQRPDGMWALAGGNAGPSQCTECGNGALGTFNPTADTNLAGGILQYQAFTIPAGVTVTVTGSTPLQILSQSEVRIDGTLRLRGADGGAAIGGNATGPAGGSGGGGGGAAGGQGGQDSSRDGKVGQGTGAAFGGTYGSAGGGGGGGSFGAAGESGATGVCPPPRCATTQYGPGGTAGGTYGGGNPPTLLGGSGGGGGAFGGADNGTGGGGGGGGGAVKILAPSIKVGGTIDARGGNGGAELNGFDGGGGGGGSGGVVWLRASAVQISGSVLATGGQGGATVIGATVAQGGAGGNGGSGRIFVDAISVSGTTNPTFTLGSAAGLSASQLDVIQPDADTVRVINLSPFPVPVRIVVSHP